MTTIDDLKDAFAARAADAPSVTDVLAGVDEVPQSSARNRNAAIAAGVLSVAAVSVAGVLISGAGPDVTHTAGRSTAAPTSAQRPSSPKPSVAPKAVPTKLEYSFRLGKVAGYDLSYGQLEPEVQVADVAVAGNSIKSIGDIRVYTKGAFDPTDAKRGTPIRVGPHSGYYANIVAPDTGMTATDGVKKPAVVWEYAPDSWAAVQGDWKYQVDNGYLSGDPQQLELSVAEAVDTTRTAPTLLPFRLTDLPQRLVTENAGSTPDGSQAEVGLTDGGRADTSMPSNTPGLGTAVSVQANAYDPDVDLRKVDSRGTMHVDNQGGYDLNLGRPVTVPGADRAFQDGAGTVTALYAHGYVTVSYTGAKPARVTAAELLRIARGMRVAKDLADRSTWFDGRTVVG